MHRLTPIRLEKNPELRIVNFKRIRDVSWPEKLTHCAGIDYAQLEFQRMGRLFL